MRRLPTVPMLLAVLAAWLSAGAAQTSTTDVILRPGAAATLAGAWRPVPDAAAAGGVAVSHPNAGAPKLTSALASPLNYFELSFAAEAGIRYRLWLRGRAQSDYWGNDSVFVQFDNAVGAGGAAAYRIGTTGALTVNLEDCSGCGLSAWGWQDTGWGSGVLGPEVVFATSGTQRMRVQTREDGFTIDQIVLSPERFRTAAPGALKNDTTILPMPGEGATPTLVRRPYLQGMSAHGVLVVWATRESGTPQVHLTAGGSARTVTGSSRVVPASTSGLAFDYYHHEVALDRLVAGTTYAYDAKFDEQPIASATFTTPPATGTGAFRFIAFGDSGTGSAEQRQLAAVMASDTFDLALHTGDIAYGNAGGTGDATYRTFNDWFFGVYAAWLPSRAFFPSPGNHDSRPSNGDGRAYLDVFTLPTNGASPAYPNHAERFYSFDYGPVHFVALDTEFAFQDPARRTEQLSWLESDLAATVQPWKVAFFHRSPYSAGGEHGSDLEVRSAFSPVLERYGVQLVLSAHEHDYERTVPLRMSASGTPVTYVVTGGGGAPLYPAGAAEWTAFSAARHHYVRGAVSECAIDLAAVGLDGRVFDAVRLERCVTGPPPASPDVILYAAEAPVRVGRWVVEPDAAAAGGARIRHPDRGAAKLTAPLASPPDFFEMTFDAAAGIPYRIWMRARADRDGWANDSVFAQFDRAVNAAGAATLRIGTTDGTTLNLEDCSGCGLSGWGWQDNGWGTGVLGPPIYFQRAGTQRLRIQTREDGLAIDQIVISPDRYLSAAPGSLKDDSTVLRRP